MENKMDEKPMTPSIHRRIPWAGLGVMFTTSAVIVLISAFCFSFYRISYLSKQLVDAQAQLQMQVDSLQTTVSNVSQSVQQTNDETRRAIVDLRQAENIDKDASHVIQAQ